MLETGANLSDNNGIRTHKHLVCKRTLSYLTKLAQSIVMTLKLLLNIQMIWVILMYEDNLNKKYNKLIVFDDVIADQRNYKNLIQW